MDTCCLIPEILAFNRLQQEDYCKFEASGAAAFKPFSKSQEFRGWRWLRALAAPAEDRCSVPSTHMEAQESVFSTPFLQLQVRLRGGDSLSKNTVRGGTKSLPRSPGHRRESPRLYHKYITVTPVPEAPMPFSDLMGTRHTCGVHIYIQSNIHIHSHIHNPYPTRLLKQ